MSYAIIVIAVVVIVVLLVGWFFFPQWINISVAVPNVLDLPRNAITEQLVAVETLTSVGKCTFPSGKIILNIEGEQQLEIAFKEKTELSHNITVAYPKYLLTTRLFTFHQTCVYFEFTFSPAVTITYMGVATADVDHVAVTPNEKEIGAETNDSNKLDIGLHLLLAESLVKVLYRTSEPEPIEGKVVLGPLSTSTLPEVHIDEFTVTFKGDAVVNYDGSQYALGPDSRVSVTNFVMGDNREVDGEIQIRFNLPRPRFSKQEIQRSMMCVMPFLIIRGPCPLIQKKQRFAPRMARKAH